MSSIKITTEVSTSLPTRFGYFNLLCFTVTNDSCEHVALIAGEVKNKRDVLVRIHSECLTGDVFGSLRCDCGEQLQYSLHSIAHLGVGVFIYLRQEGRGIGLLDKVRSYSLQEQGFDTVDANLLLGHQPDERNYHAASCLLKALEIKSIVLLTNNPSKIDGLKKDGILISSVQPLQPTINEHNAFYIKTKVARMGHNIDISEEEVT